MHHCLERRRKRVNDLAVLGSEALITGLSGAGGFLLCYVFGRRALNAEIRVVQETKERIVEKENELTKIVERSLLGDSKINTREIAVLLTCAVCPTCKK